MDDWRKRAQFTTNDLHLLWDVVYEPGVLKADGYKNGELVAVCESFTSGELSALDARADRTELAVDGLAHVDLTALDSAGHFVGTACPMISCTIEGPARLVGMDAGDLYDLSLYSSPERKMFNGKLMALLQADAPGEVKVKFTAENGLTAEVSLTIKE